MADPERVRSAALLLVDDEELVRPVVAAGLRRAGHDVLEAGSAERALDLLADPARVVDLLITDIRMPGMDGPELARRALALRPGLRVLFVSGSPDLPADAEALPGPLLLKPFRRPDLLAAIAVLLDTPG